MEYAFPHSERPSSQLGLTLRDYFAGQALAGIQARFDYTPKYAAEQAYSLADAMLKARGGG